MILILKLANGQDVMGRVDEARLLDADGAVVVQDPMYIAEGFDDSYFSTRLEDGMMLSSENSLTFKKQHVITYYSPVEALEQYYVRAVEYNKKSVRPKIHSQIRDAASQLDERLRELEDKNELLSKILRRASGNPSLH